MHYYCFVNLQQQIYSKLNLNYLAQQQPQQQAQQNLGGIKYAAYAALAQPVPYPVIPKVRLILKLD